MLFRDATLRERRKFSDEVSYLVKYKYSQQEPVGRCSLIQMTPRGDNLDGFESNRSEGVQLTGIKPKALEFISPVKSPAEKLPFSSASTKDQTTGGNTFGLSNCIFKCEIN